MLRFLLAAMPSATEPQAQLRAQAITNFWSLYPKYPSGPSWVIFFGGLLNIKGSLLTVLLLLLVPTFFRRQASGTTWGRRSTKPGFVTKPHN